MVIINSFRLAGGNKEAPLRVKVCSDKIGERYFVYRLTLLDQRDIEIDLICPLSLIRSWPLIHENIN